MFGLSPIRLYLYAAVAAALAFVLWREHHVVQRAKALTIELATSHAQTAQLAATIATERERTRIANEAEKTVVAKLDQLERDAREHPLPRLRCHAAAAVLSANTGTAVAGEAAQADDAGADAADTDASFDPTPELDHYATDAEANLVQCTEAIKYLEGLGK